jgi:ABC-type Fe3+/spermidine/putrescine transport system ATPase subunit
MVTHDLRQALLLADAIAVLVDGALAQMGPRDEVLRQPAGPEVARLVGMVNLLPGVGAGPVSGGLTRIVLGPGAELASSASLPEGTPVWVGIRPENVKLEPAHGDDVARLGRATVLRIVSDGVLATTLLEWAGLELRTHLVAGRGLGHTLKRGDRVSITIRPEDIHLLPRSDS